MNLRRFAYLGLCTLTLALAPACGGDDSEEDTAGDEVDTSTSGSETTDTGGSETGTSTTTTDTGGSTETDTGAMETGGSTETGTDTGAMETGGSTETGGMAVCDSCGPDEYCHASIIDAPTEYSCEPIPNQCGNMSTCECIGPIVCPETLQSCEELDGLITIECVEG